MEPIVVAEQHHAELQQREKGPWRNFIGFRQSENAQHIFVVSITWLCAQHTRPYRTSTPHRRLVFRQQKN
jgi:hypothetical protein